MIKKRTHSKKVSNIKILMLLTLIVFVFSLCKIGDSLASTENFTLSNAEVSSKSDSVEVNSFSTSGNTIANNVTFHKVGDYVTYKLTITNNDSKAYTVKSISTTGNSDNITYEYSSYEGTKIDAGKSQTFEITEKYSKELGDTAERQKGLSTKLEFTFEDENGGETKTSISMNETLNPKTGDNIKTYIAISVASFVMLIIMFRKNSIIKAKQNSKGRHSSTKKNKSGIKFLALLLAATIIVPTVAKASSNPFTIKFESQFKLNDKIVVTYTVDGETITKVIDYGETTDSLPKPSKPGYVFRGWEYEDGTPYDPNTPITENTKIVPKFDKMESNLKITVSDEDEETSSKTITIENELSNASDNDVQIQYSTDGGETWQDYTGPITVDSEGEIQVRTIVKEDGTVIGNADKTIDNIKTESVITITVSDADTMTDSKEITITATVNNNITDDQVVTQYSLDGGTTWADYTGPVSVSDNGDIQVRTIKKDDNTVIGTAESPINNLSPRADITVTVSDENTQTTSKQLTIETDLHNIAETDTTIQYSTDGGQTWNDYTGPVTIRDEGDVLVRVVDGTGTAIGEETKNIDNIIIQSATFQNGWDTYSKMCEVAGSFSGGGDEITEFRRYREELDTSTMTSDNIISTDDSEVPIYIWYDNGIIYWWSEAQKVYLNPDSSDMFEFRNITNIDLSKLDTSKVTDMHDMFTGCESLTSLDLSSFDTSNVTNISRMFCYCSNLTSINLSSFDTSNVEAMTYVFDGCKKLKTIDLKSFNTEKVTYMSGMFVDCESLEELDLSNFNTSNVVSMSYMFRMCYSLKSVDLSSFDTRKVISFDHMFSACNSLETIDISTFNTTQANRITVYYMFYGGPMKTIYVSDKFVTDNMPNTYMFMNTNKLVGGAGTTYTTDHWGIEYARIDDPENGKPGYFTLKQN